MPHPENQDDNDLKSMAQEMAKLMEGGQIMNIPVQPKLSLPVEMVERWHADLRKIIELQESNGRLQLLVYETQGKVASLKTLVKTLDNKLTASQLTQNDEVGEPKQAQYEESKRNKELTETVQQLRVHIRTMEADRQRLVAESERAHQIHCNVKTTLTQCQNNLTACNQEMDRIRCTLERIKKEVVIRDATIERYAASSADLLNQRAGLQNEVARLKERLEEIRKAIAAQQKTEPSDEVLQLRGENARLKDEQKELKYDRTFYLKRLTEIKKDRDDRVNGLLKERDQLKEELDSLKWNSTQMNNEAYVMGQRATEAHENLVKVQAEFDHLRASYKCLDEERISLVNEKLELTAARDHVQNQLQSLQVNAEQNTKAIVAKQTEGLRNALEALREENKDLSENLTQMTSIVNARDIQSTNLEKEVDRLKEGRFTEEEFQALCHRFQKGDCQRFCWGCLNYWLNLFGKDKLTPVLVEAAVKVIGKAQLRWLHRDHDSLLNGSDKSVDEAFAEDVVASLFELYEGEGCIERSKPEVKMTGLPIPINHRDFTVTLDLINDSKLDGKPIKQGQSATFKGGMIELT
jgi:chromosome segregation ATPase